MRDANRYIDGIFKFYTFFDKLSYKTLSILSYGLKDMIYARFAYLLEFFGKQRIR
jgi:hypothetical protein